MGMPTGPAPSAKRRRNNPDTFSADVRTVQDTGKVHGPAIEDAQMWPKVRYATDEDLTVIRAFWMEWRRAPQAADFTSTDWQRLDMLLPLLLSYLHKPTAMTFAEIRQNLSLLGATPVDRMRARIKVEKPPTGDAPAKLSVVDEYRDALGA